MKSFKRKKNLLIVLAILLTIVGLGIITSTLIGILPSSLALVIPFIILIILKIGKDVDVLVDMIHLMEIVENKIKEDNNQ
ncbi:hypothetical protein OAD97_00455 [bacterium]|nr:hypothetical protein [bacterium]